MFLIEQVLLSQIERKTWIDEEGRDKLVATLPMTVTRSIGNTIRDSEYLGFSIDKTPERFMA